MTVLDPRPAPAANAVALSRDDVITRLPVLILFPHSRCNCRCVMCDIWRSTGRDELSVEAISRWTGEWQRLGVERIVLSGGEALLHSEIWSLCETMRNAGIGISILSTGLLLTRHAENVARYSDDVVVSLDGPAGIHDAIRNIPRAFERLAEGVAAVKRQGTGVVVSGRCTVQQANHRVIRETVRAAHAVGLDRISFLAADVSSSAFNRPDGWGAERVGQVALAASDLPQLAAELNALENEFAEDFASGYIAESPQKLRERLLDYFAALNGAGEFHPNVCNAPWVSSVIEADGTVRPCFFQPALGNVNETGSLEAVLNSAEAVAWRKGLDVERDAICRKCVCTLNLSTRAS
jgi:MoaA/NifB/PqqE/SkfB family radical SAM enzyme